jgi:hypothetical protein
VCNGIIVKQLKINMKEKIKMKWDSREKQNVGFKSWCRNSIYLLVHHHHIKHIVKEVGDNRSRELEKQFNEKILSLLNLNKLQNIEKLQLQITHYKFHSN